MLGGSEFDTLIASLTTTEATSLGTPAVQAVRRQTSPETIAAVLARTAALTPRQSLFAQQLEAQARRIGGRVGPGYVPPPASTARGPYGDPYGGQYSDPYAYGSAREDDLVAERHGPYPTTSGTGPPNTKSTSTSTNRERGEVGSRIDTAAYQRALGDELRSLRKRRGWTREDLNERLQSDISLQTLATYELGTRQFSVVRLVEICRALDVAAHDVLARVHDRVFGDTPAGHLTLNLTAIAAIENLHLRPLTRWAAGQLHALPPGVSPEVYLDAPALESMAQLCQLSTVELIRILHTTTAVKPDNLSGSRKMASIGEVRASLKQAGEILRESYRNVRSAQEGLDEAVAILAESGENHRESPLPPEFVRAKEGFPDQLELMAGTLKRIQRLTVAEPHEPGR